MAPVAKVATSWHSYPSSRALGHPTVRDILYHPHIIEEKVDGSQFSFGKFEEEVEGMPGMFTTELRVRSRGAVMFVDAPEHMFKLAVQTVKSLADQLHLGWTYRAEVLAKRKQVTLEYDRVPKGNLILFDVSTGCETWLTYDQKKDEAGRLGLECVPLLAYDEMGGRTTLEQLRAIIDTTQSVLGGQLIEGIVIKPTIPLFDRDGKTILAKFVSERFKESHSRAWKAENLGQNMIVDKIVETFATPARWNKAIQHLREAGQLQDAPEDIGKLIAEIQKDFGIECKGEVQRMLWRWCVKDLQRGVSRGFPEYYKQELLRRQFEQEATQEPDKGPFEHLEPLETLVGAIVVDPQHLLSEPADCAVNATDYGAVERDETDPPAWTGTAPQQAGESLYETMQSAADATEPQQ